jgi:hypothetical protein
VHTVVAADGTMVVCMSVAVTAIKFANADNDLVAYSSDDGTVVCSAVVRAHFHFFFCENSILTRDQKFFFYLEKYLANDYEPFSRHSDQLPRCVKNLGSD